MADMEDKKGVEIVEEVEIENEVAPAVVQPAPPNVLEQAMLGNLDLIQAEIQSRNHPLDFSAGPDEPTPLHLAAMQGHDEIVEFILNHPDISREVGNAKDCFDYTPLHLAARGDCGRVVRLLTMSSLVLPDRFLAATCEPDDFDETSAATHLSTSLR